MIITKLIERFTIHEEEEDFEIALSNINKGVYFKGTNLWILIFAIFIASLGLNVNSTAVIIGAMLISPLMGPIMGLGLSAAINDLKLLRTSGYNLLIAALAGLITSTVYFLISPLNQAHAELLARTSPTIYDVLIALFGGFAGTLATFSKQKGNVIPGAAIATALMPPLCTAGYGLATMNWNFFFGASYLFLINAVFIAYATLLTTRLLKFPKKQLVDPVAEIKAKRYITAIVIFTLIPSIYLGYNIVRQDRFTKNATLFIEKEGTLPNDYLLNKKIDAKEKSITLIYGGKEISENEIAMLRNKLAYYELDGASLEVKQGFSYLEESNINADDQHTQLSKALALKDAEVKQLRFTIDSVRILSEKGKEVFAELKIQYPNLTAVTYNPSCLVVNSTGNQPSVPLISIQFKQPQPGKKDKAKISSWLRVRLKQEKIKILFE